MSPKTTTTVKMDAAKDTKRTRVFVEPEPAKIGRLYVPLATLADMGDESAKSITLTVALA